MAVCGAESKSLEPITAAEVIFRDLSPCRLAHSMTSLVTSKVAAQDFDKSITTRLAWNPGLSCNNMSVRTAFGSPSYPSPLDRIRSGKRERAAQFGLDLQQAQYEANQSFPGVRNNVPDVDENPPLPKLDDFKGDGANDVSFAASFTKGSFVEQPSGWGPINDLNSSVGHALTSRIGGINGGPASLGPGSSFLGGSWSFYNYIGIDDSNAMYPTSIRNPNKAVCTINARTTEILVANDICCELFHYSKKDLIGTRLSTLVKLKNRDQAAVWETHIDEGGQLVQISGKVLDAVDSMGLILPVSVWLKQLPNDDVKRLRDRDECVDPRCIVIMEPVEHTTAKVTVGHKGTILNCDQHFVVLFGYHCASDLKGCDITSLIKIKLPESGKFSKDLRKQTCTGRTKDGAAFPCTARLRLHDDADSMSSAYDVILYVFANISGLLTFHPDWTIHSCNHYFSTSMMGYAQHEVVGKPITQFLPNFYDELDLIDSDSMPLPPIDVDDVLEACDVISGSQSPFCKDFRPLVNDDVDTVQSGPSDQPIGPISVRSAASDHGIGESINTLDGSGELEKKELEVSDLEKLGTGELLKLASQAIVAARLSPLNDSVKTDELFDSESEQDVIGFHSNDRCGNLGKLVSELRNSTPNLDRNGCHATPKRPPLVGNDLMTSTPGPGRLANENGLARQKSHVIVPEGNYCGQCRHRDGNLIAVIYQIKRLTLENGKTLYAVWMCRDPEDPAVTYTLASSFNSTMDQSHTSLNFHKEISRVNESPMPSRPKDEESASSAEGGDDDYEEVEADEPSKRAYLSEGRYEDKYDTHQSIGKGAFGFVKLARRKKDGKDVVVKFIKKAKVLSECWVITEHGKVPLELSLLSTLSHPSIVSLLGAYESDEFFHLVMEKHGEGMDLFEFIDRYPSLDEPLISYMFRQMVEAVDYLHTLNIVHRDIKDENIILNQYFHIKLIDFGSAAFMDNGGLFGTFCGTVEYCSPEVLMGNKYHGPELEMWSLGVTLYTLVFGENPFYDVDETIKAVLKPPFKVSVGLMHVIGWLLARDPKKRATIRDMRRHLWVTQPVDITLYDFKDVLPNYEFHGNIASDNRPDDVVDSPPEQEGIGDHGHVNSRLADLAPPPRGGDNVDGCEETDQLLDELERCLRLDELERRTLSV